MNTEENQMGETSKNKVFGVDEDGPQTKGLLGDS